MKKSVIIWVTLSLFIQACGYTTCPKGFMCIPNGTNLQGKPGNNGRDGKDALNCREIVRFSVELLPEKYKKIDDIGYAASLLFENGTKYALLNIPQDCINTESKERNEARVKFTYHLKDQLGISLNKDTEGSIFVKVMTEAKTLNEKDQFFVDMPYCTMPYISGKWSATGSCFLENDKFQGIYDLSPKNSKLALKADWHFSSEMLSTKNGSGMYVGYIDVEFIP